jgi:hypothetical protein
MFPAFQRDNDAGADRTMKATFIVGVAPSGFVYHRPQAKSKNNPPWKQEPDAGCRISGTCIDTNQPDALGRILSSRGAAAGLHSRQPWHMTDYLVQPAFPAFA